MAERSATHIRRLCSLLAGDPQPHRSVPDALAARLGRTDEIELLCYGARRTTTVNLPISLVLLPDMGEAPS